MEDKETIGFHKGALSTLIKEREELVRIISIVDQLIKAHKTGLEELGVNLEQNRVNDNNKVEDSSEERSP